MYLDHQVCLKMYPNDSNDTQRSTKLCSVSLRTNDAATHTRLLRAVHSLLAHSRALAPALVVQTRVCCPAVGQVPGLTVRVCTCMHRMVMAMCGGDAILRGSMYRGRGARSLRPAPMCSPSLFAWTPVPICICCRVAEQPTKIYLSI